MSQVDQDAIVGRLVRERNDAIRLMAALDAQLSQIADLSGKAFRQLRTVTPEQIGKMLEPVKDYFNVDAIVALLSERKSAQSDIAQRENSLRELGANEPR